MHDAAVEFLDHIDEDRPWAASRMALELLADAGPVALVDQLLAPVQLESGARWQSGAYTVAQEHEVTGLVDELLGAATVELGEPEPDEPTVTLVCAEGEWHATPARMTALRLRWEGWNVRFLGGSLPARELEAHLRRDLPDALLVSCTMSAALVGTAEMTAVARRVGIPTVVGGAAIDLVNGGRAALGADAVVGSAEQAAATLHAWRERGGPTPMVDVGDEGSADRASFAALRRRLVQSVIEQTPGPFRPEDEAELDGLLATLESSLLLTDAGVLEHHIAWLAEREATRQVLPVPLERVVQLLQRSLPPDLRTPRSYLTTAAARLRSN